MQERLERMAFVGAGAWLVLWLVPVRSVLGFPLVERLVLAGPLIVAPLCLAGWMRRDAGASRWLTVLGWTLLPAAVCTAVSSLVSPGTLSAALTTPWLLWTAVMGAVAGLSALRRRLLPIAELAFDAGFAYLPVGAVWWFASRAQIPLLGFDPVIVTLTAAHFHFAGLAALTITGGVGRLLGPRLRRLYPVAAVLVVGTPILVALGILGSPALEVTTAVLLAIGVVALSICLIAAATQYWGESKVACLALVVAALSSFASMSLAVVFALGEFTGLARPSILTMAQSHGLLNALGFALPALLGIHALERRRGHRE